MATYVPTIYVDATNGSDSNDGSSAVLAFQTVAAAMAAATHGDVIFFAEGDYTSTPIDVPSGKALTFVSANAGTDPGSWTSGEVILDRIVSLSSITVDGIHVHATIGGDLDTTSSNGPYWQGIGTSQAGIAVTVKNSIIDGEASGVINPGFDQPFGLNLTYGGGDVVVDNVHFLPFTGLNPANTAYGMWINATNPASSVTITDNVFETGAPRNAAVAFDAQHDGPNIIISGNSFEDPGTSPGAIRFFDFINGVSGTQNYPGITGNSMNGDGPIVSNETGDPVVVNSNDVITGTGANETFLADGGNDTVDGAGGADTYDMAAAGSNGSVVDLATGYSFSAATGYDTLSNIENAKGSTGSDVFIGNGGDNVFIATTGSDTFNGNGNGANGDTFDASAAATAITVNLNGGTTGGAFTANLSNVENVKTGTGNDTITLSAANNEVDAGAGFDTAISSANYADLSFSYSVADGFTVGGDKLKNVEKLDLADKDVWLVHDSAELTHALDNASAGDVIKLASGTYSGHFVIDVDGLTIESATGNAADVTIVGDFRTQNPGLGSGNLNEWIGPQAAYNGGTNNYGFSVLSDGVTIRGLTIKDQLDAILIGQPQGTLTPDTSVNGLTIDNVVLDNNVFGVHKAIGTIDTDGFTFTNSTISHGYEGMDIVQLAGGSFTDVLIDNVTFEHLTAKGIYAEAMNDAMLTGINMTDVAQYGRGDGFGNIGEHGVGIDLNLKYGNYSGITITDFEFSDVGLSNGAGTSHANASGIAIKARNDGPSYGPTDATVTGVTISDGTIDGTSTGIRVGEAGKVTTDTGVTITNVVITDAAADYDNRTTSTVTVNVDADDHNVMTHASATGSFDYSAGSGSDTITGSSANDTIEGGAGSDNIDAKGGIDKVVYNGALTSGSFTYSGGKWSVTGTDGTDTLSGVERVVDSNGKVFLLVGADGTDGYAKIQDAIDAATGGETILIAPGTYTETSLYVPGDYQGLYINKANLSLVGFSSATGSAVTSGEDARDFGPTVIAGAQNMFGANHWIDVGGTGTSITGLHLQAGGETNNKLLEIWADGTSVKDNFVDVYQGGSSYTGAIAVYYNENGNQVATYTFTENLLNEGIMVANGVGNTGSAANQQITDNSFIGPDRYDTITLQGQVLNVGWLLSPVGLPTITGNTLEGNTTPFLLRFADDNLDTNLSRSYIEAFLASNASASTQYAYVLTSGGDLRIAPRDYGAGPSDNYYVMNTIDSLNLALDTTADDVFGGQRVTQQSGDTIIVQSGSAAVDSQIMVDNLTVQATANSTDLDLTLATTLADGSPIAGGGVQTITLADYATNLGANVDVTGNALNNTIHGNSGANNLAGLGGTDVLNGGAGNDTVDGGAGNDTIDGGTGNDSLSGGDDDDRITGGSGDDTVDGGAGIDTVVFGTASTTNTISFNGGTNGYTIAGSEGSDALSNVEKAVFTDKTIWLVDSSAELTTALANAADGDVIQLASGKQFDGTFTINDKAVTILGADAGGGIDDAPNLNDSVIHGRFVITGTKNVTIDGVQFLGDDTSGHTGQATASVHITGSGTHTITNSLFYNNATTPGGQKYYGVMLPTGFTGQATISDNVFNAVSTAHSSIFTGGNAWRAGVWSDGTAAALAVTGNSFAWTNTGLNIAIYDNTKVNFSFNDFVTGAGSINTVSTTIAIGASPGSSFTNINNNTTSGARSDVSFRNVNTPVFFDFNASSHTAVTGSGNTNYPNEPPAPQSWVEILGGTAGDTLKGSEGWDIIAGDGILPWETTVAGGGADVIEGRGGNDWLTGHLGNDTIDGGTGNDIIDGGADNDSLNGGADNDSILGGAGMDSIEGGTGADTLKGGDDNDTVNGGDGNDSIEGNAGADVLTGGNNGDTVSGGDGNDTITGDSGGDSLLGGNNDDSITGGDGNDTIDAGAGTDTVVFEHDFTEYDIEYDEGTQTYALTRDGVVDTVKGVEFFKFGTKIIDVSGDPNAVINKFDPNISGPSVVSLAEGAVGEVYDTAATDADAEDPFGAIVYSLDAGADTGFFTIDPVTGEIFLTNPADYETKTSYSVTVRATQGSTTSTKALTFNVTDSNDTNPSFSSGASVSVDENTATSVVIHTAVASDPDTVGGALTYSLVPGGDSAAFTINPNNGQIKFNASPDFETKTQYTFDIKATQGTTSTVQTFTVNIEDEVEDILPVEIVNLSIEKGMTKSPLPDVTNGTNDMTFDVNVLTLNGNKVYLANGTLLTAGMTGLSLADVNGLTIGTPGSVGSNVSIQFVVNKAGFDEDTWGYNVSVIAATSSVTDGTGTANLLDGGDGNDTINGLGGNDTIYGSGGHDSIFGGAADDEIHGGKGKDTLNGGTGADKFVFDTALNAKQADLIVGFTHLSDKIVLSGAIFAAIGPTFIANEFKASATATPDGTDHILYETDTGKLFYDADSNGAGAKVLIATLDNKATLTFDDFIYIA